MTLQRTAAIIPAHVSPEQLNWLLGKCSDFRANARVVSDGNFSGPEPMVVIAALPVRERRIPKECLHFINHHAPRASLLLICDEPLVRPSVSLVEGRVTLIAWSSGLEAVCARLRVLLVEMAESDMPLGERATAHWWAACQIDSRAAPVGADAEGSLRIAFGLNGISSQSEMPPSAHLGLSSLADTWQIEWPDAPGTLWLLSALRLPAVSDLAAAYGGKGPVSVRAASGDITLAVTRSVGRSLSAETLKDLPALTNGGGPPLFDAISDRARGCVDGGVLVVEIR